MAMRRCDADEHYYDDKIDVCCPFCHGDMAVTRRLENRKLTLDDIARDRARSAAALSQPEPSELPVTAVYGYRRPLAPVAGWLVISRCPPDRYGRDHTGTDLRLVYGTNRIGRAATMSAPLDYGDDGIAREDHCFISCDRQSSHVYLMPGDTRHQTYFQHLAGADTEIQWQPLLQRERLSAMALIRVSETVLQYVPCPSRPAD